MCIQAQGARITLTDASNATREKTGKGLFKSCETSKCGGTTGTHMYYGGDYAITTCSGIKKSGMSMNDANAALEKEPKLKGHSLQKKFSCTVCLTPEVCVEECDYTSNSFGSKRDFYRLSGTSDCFSLEDR